MATLLLKAWMPLSLGNWAGIHQPSATKPTSMSLGCFWMWVTIITIHNDVLIVRTSTATRQKQTNKKENSQTPKARLKKFTPQFEWESPLGFLQHGKFGF